MTMYTGIKHGLTLRKKHGLKVSGNKVLWKLYGPNRDEIIKDGKITKLRDA